MAAISRVLLQFAFFSSYVLGKHECERPCQVNGISKECYYNFTLKLNFQKCMNSKNEECRRRMVLSINNQSPGPMISVCKNDTLIVDVKNNLPSGMETSIHWHGLEQKNTPQMDGVPMITQCPIHSGTTFRYRMIVDRGGTFYYHAHSVLQQLDGLLGALIVREDTKEDKIILFIPRFHNIMSFQRGLANDLNSAELISFTYGSPKSSRARLINAAALDCPLSISAGKMIVTAVDGNKVKPTESTRLKIYPGERIDVISDYDFEIIGKHLCEGQKIGNNLKIKGEYLHYNNLNSISDIDLSGDSHRVYIPFDMIKYSYSDNPVDLRYKLGEITPHIPSYINENSDTVSIYQFRNVSFLYPSSPLLSQAKDVDQDIFCMLGTVAKRCEPKKFCECLHLLKLTSNKSVDLVIVNEGRLIQQEQTIHFHGNRIRLLATASFQRPITQDEVKMIIESGESDFNLINPIEKDTIVVPKMGYIVVRLKTDNPGYWMLESIPSKAKSGMGLEILIHVPYEDDTRLPPRGFPRCQNLKPQDLVIIEE